ncbi:MAG: molecular chaperone Hsp33 [Micavibrio sp.]|nr:molecular chaperone Hsp33 [Micavibrio sp.]
MVNDDVVQPFQLESSSLRGRLVRLGPVLDDILGAHDYPLIVSKLVAETTTLALLLSSMLKYEGVFTLQMSSDGPVTMVVADVTTQGHVRACATFSEERLLALKKKEPSFEQLVGKGYLAFTVDQGENTERYQGIVSLEGESLLESIEHYFAQSEQIGTGLKMAIGMPPNNKKSGWRAGAIMLQHLPEHGEHLDKADRKTIDFKEDSQDMEEDWQRANILLETCTAEEFLSPSLDGNNLLMRLFHEEGVRVFTPLAIQKKCRCSLERSESVILALSEEELRNAAKEDKMIHMTCEFCSQTYDFALDKILKKKEKLS